MAQVVGNSAVKGSYFDIGDVISYQARRPDAILGCELKKSGE